MRTALCCNFLLAAWSSFWYSAHAQMMCIDLGHEFFKVGLMRKGKDLEIVLNAHSKRKTPTAASFFEQVRAFGDDALAHSAKAPTKVPLFYHALLGRNFTSAADVQKGGAWWEQFGLGDRFYPYELGYDEERGVPTFAIGAEQMQGEEVLAHLLTFAKQMAEASDGMEGQTVRDLVVTVPSDASLRQRQAIVAAGEIAGLRVLTLVHETSAFSVQRAVDIKPEKDMSEIHLFYNLGSRKAEVSVVKFESRSAGMVAGKMAPVVTVLGSAVDTSIGGHLMDLKIAEAMLKKFQDKYPKLAEGIATNARALRKLLGQSQKSKAILSANKGGPFIVESLYEDTDFQSSIKREEFEGMIQGMLDKLTEPITKALEVAGVTLQDVTAVEVVGGAWRVPKVQSILSEFLEKGKGGSLPIGQHLNGEEGAANGGALVGANQSNSFRIRKIFFQDRSMHEYAVQVASLTGEWERNYTVLFPAGSPLGGGKKKVTLNATEDFKIKLFEDGVLMSEYMVTGLAEILEGKWKDKNLTGTPKISTSVSLEGSGLVEIKKPSATVEETYWVNVTVEVPKPAANATDDASGNEEEKSADAEKAEATPEGEKPVEEAVNADGEEAANASADANASGNATEEPVYEVVQQMKKRKNEKKLTLERVDYKPKPLSEAAIAEVAKKVKGIIEVESEILAAAGLKNDLEAAIYSSRDKLEGDSLMKVSTEEQRQEITTLTMEYEDWMYEPGATKTDYSQRLQKLQDLMGPIEERALELESRSDVVEMVDDVLTEVKKTKATIVKNMTWVSENKTEAANKKLTEFEAWWDKKMEQQRALPLHEAPAFTKTEVQEKLKKMQDEWITLSKIKKPKAKKESKEADAKAKKTKDKKAAKSADAFPMDLAAAETYLKDIQAKKLQAVNDEDFDKADEYKKTEKALKEHIDRLKAANTEL